jgi:hypothetical protein
MGHRDKRGQQERAARTIDPPGVRPCRLPQRILIPGSAGKINILGRQGRIFGEHASSGARTCAIAAAVDVAGIDHLEPIQRATSLIAKRRRICFDVALQVNP